MFHPHHLSFSPPDPLGAGIREEIQHQRDDPMGRIDLFEHPTGEQLQDYLKQLLSIDDSTLTTAFVMNDA